MTRASSIVTALGLSLICLGGSAVHGAAADFSDPDWPCIQRKVDHLSIGVMWPGLLEPVAMPATADPGARRLAAQLALRRVDDTQASALISAYLDQVKSPTPEIGAQVFSDIFRRVSQQRSRIMRGISRYARKQTALSEKIEQIRSAMRDLESARDPDFDRIDALEADLDWNERIYRDRAQALIYVCESPVLLEKHVFAMSRALQAGLK